MVNRRFIVPDMCELSFRGDIRFSYYANEEMDDINKALCSLTGDDYDAIPRMYSLEKGNIWGQWFDWGFFRCKCFKKGTMHFEFKEENVWRKFNSTVAEIKGWSLPADTSKIHKNANSFN